MIKRAQSLSLILVIFAALSFYSWRVLLPAAQANNGLPVFYTTAHVLWHMPTDMQRLYDDARLKEQMARLGYTHIWDTYGPNPPTLALFFLPLLAVPQPRVPFVWAGINLLTLIGGLIVLTAALRLPHRWSLLIFPLIAISQPVLHHFERGQLYLPLFLGLSVSYLGLVHHRANRAGVGLGLILVSKTAGAWIVLLLLLSRRWRVAMWAAVTAAFFTVISLIWNGFSPWYAYLSKLAAMMGHPSRFVTAYQTITSLFGHLLTFNPTWNPRPVFHLPWLATGLTLLTLAGTLYLSWRCGSLDDDAPPDIRLLTLAMWLALAVPNAPLAEDYHYVLLIPSLVTALWWADKVRQGQKLLIFVILLLALPLPFKHPLLAQSWLALLAYPRVYGAYLLWGWLLWQMRRANSLAKGFGAVQQTQQCCVSEAR